MKTILKMILFVLVLLAPFFAPQAQAGLNEELQACNSSAKTRRSISSCTRLIEQYSDQFDQKNMSFLYHNRARAKWDLDGWDSAEDDYVKACDLDHGTACCVLSAFYFDESLWVDDKALSDKYYYKSEELFDRGVRLGVSNEDCDDYW